MVHSGYEATAVDHTFSSFGGLVATVKAMMFNTYANPAARAKLDRAEATRGQGHGRPARVELTVAASDAA
jgi:hypothetical protein